MAHDIAKQRLPSRSKALVKSFRGPGGPVRAVRAVDLSIERSETVALLGPNGAGKSTTLDMLLGLTEPDAGAVSVFGAGPHEAIAAGEIGAMLQTGALIGDLSVRELASMMASLYPRPLDVGGVLELTGIFGFADEPTEKLSGGQTQRARLALALVSDPELLVLDEPTIGLDVEARRGFWATMRAFATRGKTVVFATHYLEETDAYADRVVLMAHGQIVADGPTTEIKAMVGVDNISGDASRGGRRRAGGPAGRNQGRAPRRHGDSHVFGLRRRHPRALLERYDDAHDIEITGAGLEQAFLALTSDQSQPTVNEELLA